MADSYDPDSEIYDPKFAAKALRTAVEQLAEDSAREPDWFSGKSLSSIAEFADETYGELPEFWRVWKNWHAPQPRQDMGDL